MNRLSSKLCAMTVVATVTSFASSAPAIPLGAGSLALKDAAGPAVETVQWRGWGGWRGGGGGGGGGGRGGWGGWRGGWGWGGVGAGLAAGAIIGGGLAA